MSKSKKVVSVEHSNDERRAEIPAAPEEKMQLVDLEDVKEILGGASGKTPSSGQKASAEAPTVMCAW